MDVSKGIFNFRDVRQVCDDKGEIQYVTEYANGSFYKHMYGKCSLSYGIAHPEYLESYSMVNDWGDTYEAGSISSVWLGHTLTFSAKALPSVIQHFTVIDTVSAPVIERIVTSKTTVGLLITNPNDFEVDLFDSNNTLIASLAEHGTYTIQDLTTVTATYYYFMGYYEACQYIYEFSKDNSTWYTEASFSWEIRGNRIVRIYTRLREIDLSKDITSSSTEVPTGPFIAYYYPGYGNCAITDYDSTFTVNFETSTVYSLTAGIRYTIYLKVPSATGFISNATVTTITGTTATTLNKRDSFEITSPVSSRSIDNQYKYCTYQYICNAADNMTGLLFTPEVFLRSNIKYLHINRPELFHGTLSGHLSQYTITYTATGKTLTRTAYSSTYHYFTEGITLTGGYWPSFGPKPSGSSTTTYYAFGYLDNGTKTSTYTSGTLHHQSTVSYITGANNNPNVKYQLLGTKDLETLYAYVGWDNYTFTSTTELTPTISSTTPYIMTVQSPTKTAECWCDNEYQFTLVQPLYMYMVFSSKTFVDAAKYLEAHTDLFMFQDSSAQFYNSTPVGFASTLAATTTQTLSVYSASAARHLIKTYCQLADVNWPMHDIVAVKYMCGTGTYSVYWCGEIDDSDGDETVYRFYGKYYNGSSWVSLSDSDYITVYHLVGTTLTTGVYYQVCQTTNAYVSGMNNFIKSHAISTTYCPSFLSTCYLNSAATTHYKSSTLSGNTMTKSSGPYMHFIATSDSSDHSTLYWSTMGTAQSAVKNFVSAIYQTQSDDVTYLYMAEYRNYSSSGGQACYWNGNTFVQLASVNMSGQAVGQAKLIIITY